MAWLRLFATADIFSGRFATHTIDRSQSVLYGFEPERPSISVHYAVRYFKGLMLSCRYL